MRIEPVTIELSAEPPVSLTLSQMDGTERIAFASEAAILAQAIEAGASAIDAFGLAEFEGLPVSIEAVRRARAAQIEVVLALEWGFLKADGIDWPREDRKALAELVRRGVPDMAIPPLFFALQHWLTGPLVEVTREGEP